MIFLLIEAENNMINPVLPVLTKSWSTSCIKKLPNKIDTAQLSVYKEPPLFESGWFLIYAGKDSSVIKTLCTLENNVIVLQAFSRSKAEVLSELLSGLNVRFKIIDNLKIDKKEKLAFIKRELHIDDKDVDYLYRRTRGYVRDLTNGVLALKTLPHVSRPDIRALVPATAKYGLSDLFNFLIGTLDSSMTYQDAIGIIFRYRYGLEFLRDFLLENLKIYMTVYDYVASGELSIENYRENRPSSLTMITERRLYIIIEQYKQISYDYLYFLYNSISAIPRKNDGILMLINVFRLRKEI